MVLPYLKGFIYLLCSVFGERFGLFLLRFLVILIFIFRSIQVLNNWHWITFLGQRREECFAIFSDLF
jgi:hypothetical protein